MEMIGRKENIFKTIVRLFEENILGMVVPDRRVRMTYSEKMRFIGQVRTLEKQGVNNVTKSVQ